MRRIPSYIILAGVAVLMFAFGILSIMAVDNTPPPQMIPTVVAMLTQMPPDQVFSKLTQMGYSISADAQATAMAMWKQGVPADVILTTILGSGNTQPTVAPPTAQPTIVPPTLMVLPSLTPTTEVIVSVPTTIGVTAQPTTEEFVLPTVEGAVPTQEGIATTDPAIPTAEEFILPTADDALPTVEGAPTTVAAGNIAGKVLFDGLETATGINLRLTRPDGTILELPVSADGAFAFSGMLPGDYMLDAYATGYLSARAEFTLGADQTVQLPDEMLIAGDTNADNVIDLSDAALIASNFDGPAVVSQADLNHDGWIDVLDLTLLGNQFGLTGPVSWR